METPASNLGYLPRYLQICLGVLTLLTGTAAAGFATAAHAACETRKSTQSDQLLFTFNTMIYAASSVADAPARAALHDFLLIYEPQDALDNAFAMRRGVAHAVEAWPRATRERMLTFLLEHRAAITNYNAVVLQWVGPPPGFATLVTDTNPSGTEQHVFADREILGKLLREAWVQDHVDGLWQQWQPSWQNAQICTSRWRGLQSALARYARLPLPGNDASELLYNPLMPEQSAVTSVYGDDHFLMVVGPALSAQGQDALITHELTHPIVHHALHNMRGLLAQLRSSDCVFAEVRDAKGESTLLTHYVYNTWESYFSEALVRGITARLYPGVAHAHRALLVSDDIALELKAFEGSRDTLPEAMPGMLSQLHAGYCGTAQYPTQHRDRPVRQFLASVAPGRQTRSRPPQRYVRW